MRRYGRYARDAAAGAMVGLVVGLAIIGWVLVVQKHKDCDAVGGVLTRGVWTYECVAPAAP